MTFMFRALCNITEFFYTCIIIFLTLKRLPFCILINPKIQKYLQT